MPQIRLKAKRIGLRAMRAGLKAKMGCHRASQRRGLPAAARRPEPERCQRAARRRAVPRAAGARNLLVYVEREVGGIAVTGEVLLHVAACLGCGNG